METYTGRRLLPAEGSTTVVDTATAAVEAAAAGEVRAGYAGSPGDLLTIAR